MLAWRSETHGGSTCGWFEWKLKWRWLEIGAARPLEAVRPRLAGGRRAGIRLRLRSRKLTLVAQPRFFRAGADRRFRDPAADHFRFGLCRHAAGALSDGRRAARDPLSRQTDRRLGACAGDAGAAVLRAGSAANTFSLGMAADDQRPSCKRSIVCRSARGSISLVGMPCREYLAAAAQQPPGRDGDRPARGLFQRPMADGGLNLLDLKYRAAGYFAADPSQMVRPDRLPRPLHRKIDAVAGIASARRSSITSG